MKQLKKLTQELNLILNNLPKITHIGNPILRQKTTKTTPKEGIKIGQQLTKTLNKLRKLTGVGRGLAAPQIGISKSVFVTYLNEQFQIYINPKIITKSKNHNFYRESCISSRVLWAVVKRPQSVTIEWTDESGQTQAQKFTGFPARLIQHEYDHLQGKLNIDIAQPGTIEYCGDVLDVLDVLKEKLPASSWLPSVQGSVPEPPV